DNEWFVRHARRILQERAAAGGLKDKATPQAALEEITLKNPDAGRRLRGLWAMYGINALTGFTALQPVSDQDEHVRGWAVRLLGDDKAGVPNGADYVWKGLTTRARQESSPLVRRELASLVLRLAAKDRQPLLAGLLSHAEDASDHNLPFLYWYALEPLAGQDPKSALDLAANGKIPILLQFTARRIATTARKQENELLAAELAKAADGKSPDVALMIL